MSTRKGSRFPWRFFRAGGVDQALVASGADVENLAALDQKLWTALACPTRGLELDPRSLDLFDIDRDGRIRPPDILGTIAWARQVFRSLDDLFDGQDAVPLSSINEANPTGHEVLAGAKRILANLGKGDAAAIALADVADTAKVFAGTLFNGDGVIPPEAAEDPAVRQAIEEVVAVMGSVPDRSGKPGVDQARVAAFFERARARADWLDAGARDPGIRALGESGPAAAAAMQGVQAKVDDFFVRSRLLSLDGRASAGLGASDGDLASLGGKDLAPDDALVARWPLARVEASRPLPLSGLVNPAWAARLAAFAQATVGPLIGPRTTLNETEWGIIQERLQPYLAWLARRPVDADLGTLSDERISVLARSGVERAISDLIARDKALESENAQIEAVERMVRVRRDFAELLRNFVNFADFYGKRKGAFQVGTLYIDGRSCDLCLPVEDVARHSSLAGLAKAYLAYCECTRRKDAEKRTIVAVVTGGDVDNLMVGRNGVFYDRKGDDWDATVTRVVENPISIRQAFWAPYKRFVRLVEEQVAKRAGAADDEAGKRLEAGARDVATVDQKKPAAAAPAKPADGGEKKIDVGTVAAIGVAVGGIATFFSSVLATFLGLGMWMPVGLVALVLAISGPSMLIGWLKLRQRNIGPILDANGWAVNAFARINVPFGAALTAVGALPPGASRSIEDPFAEKSPPWATYVTLLLLAVAAGAWFLGKADPYLPDGAKAGTVFHRAPVPSDDVASRRH